MMQLENKLLGILQRSNSTTMQVYSEQLLGIDYINLNRYSFSDENIVSPTTYYTATLICVSSHRTRNKILLLHGAIIFNDPLKYITVTNKTSVTDVIYELGTNKNLSVEATKMNFINAFDMYTPIEDMKANDPKISSVRLVYEACLRHILFLASQ